MTRPSTPAARAVVIAWATNRPAPDAEAAFPARNRARAITGAVVGVVSVASWIFSPRTPEYPNAAACLAYPWTWRTVSSTSRNAIPSPPRAPASSPGTLPTSPASSRAPTASNCCTCPWVKDRRKVPYVDGARTPANRRLIPPWRNRFRSSIQSAPASIPATTPAVLIPAFGLGTVNDDSSRSYQPAASASRNAVTRPAADTTFGSSNTGRIV